MNERLPPGQRWIDVPIVYDIARVPPVDLSEYRLRITGAVERETSLSCQDLGSLRRVQLTRDFHCVTRWSVKDVRWEGVMTKVLIELVRPAADVAWVMAQGRDGYATNVPYEYFVKEDSLLATHMNGETLAPQHGYPLRLVIPSLYAWKSAKYVMELEFLTALRRGFWEKHRYHDVGDPRREERFR